MPPTRIQRKRVNGWRMPEGAIYVGRGSKWGNPYRVDRHSTPADATYRYRTWLWHMLDTKKLDITELRDAKHLACWCPLDQPCHADVLIEMIKEMEDRPP